MILWKKRKQQQLQSMFSCIYDKTPSLELLGSKLSEAKFHMVKTAGKRGRYKIKYEYDFKDRLVIGMEGRTVSDSLIFTTFDDLEYQISRLMKSGILSIPQYDNFISDLRNAFNQLVFSIGPAKKGSWSFCSELIINTGEMYLSAVSVWDKKIYRKVSNTYVLVDFAPFSRNIKIRVVS